jgi:hypothetical protein
MSEEEKLMTTIWRVPDELWEKIEPILALLAQALEAKAHRETTRDQDSRADQSESEQLVKKTARDGRRPSCIAAWTTRRNNE